MCMNRQLEIEVLVSSYNYEEKINTSSFDAELVFHHDVGHSFMSVCECIIVQVLNPGCFLTSAGTVL